MMLRTKLQLCRSVALPLIAVLLTTFGCQWFVNDADNQVYSLIEKRQLQALGETRSAHIDQEKVPIKVDEEAYEFVPHPIDSDVPPEFEASTAAASQPTIAPEGEPATQPVNALSRVPTADLPAEPAANASAEIPPPIPPQEIPPETQPAQDVAPADVVTSQPAVNTRPARELTLSEALAYAFAHSRDFQSAKEDLYLAALALTLERHLWSPRFFGNVNTEYANYGEVRDFDHAMTTVAQVGVRQRLPLGGEVTARVIDTLMRDLTNHITTAETGAAILEANIPLLRGAGLVAYESRFQAERNLIYAVRNFENFRRSLTVLIAGDYFNLQQLRQGIVNSRESIRSLDQVAARAQARRRVGWETILNVQRAEQDKLNAMVSEANAIEAYRTALDSFKIRIGMSTEEEIEVTPADMGVTPQTTPGMHVGSLEEALHLPAVSEEEAIDVALRYRLDLLNTLDQIDDAARGVKIAENNLLPDLNASGSLTYNSDPAEKNAWTYSSERQTARAAVNLELPLDRVAERNALRSTLIDKRRAERTYEEARDTVMLQVRRAIRRVQQQQTVLQVQMINRDLAINRRRAAEIEFEKGLTDNRDIVDAERQLLNARNQLAEAQANLRLAILQFRRDTGTLRVDDEGKWAAPVAMAR